MKRFILFLSLIAGFCTSSFAQGAKNIKINEVLTNNTENLVDAYGHRHPWIELANNSFTTYNVRGMFITTNKKVLDNTLSVPERIKLMSQIPNGSKKTVLEGQQHAVFFLNALPSHGDMYLDAKLDGTKEQWIALYDGNAVDLIDSITVPVLAENTSYAREKNGSDVWIVKGQEFVSPGLANVSTPSESKIAKLKKDDPYGIGITVLAMGVVFFCLALLYFAFALLGRIMNRSKTIKYVIDMDNPANRKLEMNHAKDEEIALAPQTQAEAVPEKAKEPEMSLEIAAVIAQAIGDYQDDVHVEESGIITIMPRDSRWRM